MKDLDQHIHKGKLILRMEIKVRIIIMVWLIKRWKTMIYRPHMMKNLRQSKMVIYVYCYIFIDEFNGEAMND